MSMSIAAVVLNYGTPDDTLLAVRSLLASNHPVSPLIVVDNASGDDSVARLRMLPGVDLLPLPANGGFSAGCNAGIRRALDSSPAAVLLVNSDAVVPPDAVARLALALESDARAGIAGPLVRSRTNPDVIESAGISYDMSTGRMRLRHNGKRVHPESDGAALVDAVSGCAMLVRRQVFDEVGFLAEEYFFGFEDIDFCLRARARGWATYCDPSVFVLHEGHRSIGRRSGRRLYFATRNHLLLATRFPPGGSWLTRAVRLAMVMALNLGHAASGRVAPRVAGLAGWTRGVVDFARGRFGAV